MQRTAPPTSTARLDNAVDYWAYRSALALLLALPAPAAAVAVWLGWHIFYLEDVRILSLWGLAAVVGGGWPFFAGTQRRLLGQPGTADVAVATAATVLYGAGLYWSLAHSGGPAVLLGAAPCLIALAAFGRLVAALRSRHLALSRRKLEGELGGKDDPEDSGHDLKQLRGERDSRLHGGQPRERRAGGPAEPPGGS